MTPRISQIAALCFATLAAGKSPAQAAPADVTFEVPINLTRLVSDITMIKVVCKVTSIAINPGSSHAQPRRERSGEVVLNVSQGAVVTTAQVVVSLSTAELDNPSGKQATYECRLGAPQQPQGTWRDLHSSSGYTLTPPLAPITGSFVW